MTLPNNSNCTKLMNAIYDAYGSKKNFEYELIKEAYSIGNKGKIYVKINNYCNLTISTKPKTENEHILLICNLDYSDIFNFIEDIDYSKLSNAYFNTLILIQSQKIVRL